MLNLNQGNNDLKLMKDKVIKYVLREQQKLGLIKTDAEYQAEYLRLSEAANKDMLTMQVREQSGLTNVKAFNDNLSEIYIDLLTAFEKMNAVGSVIDQHQKLNTSIINNMKTKLYQLSDNVSILEDKYSIRTSDTVHIENFRSTDSFETNIDLYTDENGELVSDAYRVSYDKYNECVKLPKLISINKLIAINGQKMAVLKINKQLGSGLVNLKNPSNIIDKAIDTDLESYWEETILADEPIRVELDKDKYYKVGFGAVCELEVVFNNIVEINEISLLPFGRFPMEVLAIRYYHSDQPDDEEKELLHTKGNLKSIEIVSPNKTGELKSKMISNNISFQFPSVAAKRLRIILNQPHYIKSSFAYDKREIEKNDIWFNKSSKVSFKFKKPAQGLYKQKSLRDLPWVLFNKAVEKMNGKIDIEEMLFPKKTEIIPLTKYEYTYGLYNISINENNYKNLGIYISKPIKLNENINQVTLSADETKPTSDYDIKYFITTKLEPSSKDWFPIDNHGSLNFKDMMTSGELTIDVDKQKFFGTVGSVVELQNTPFTDFSDLTKPPVKISIIDKNGTLINESSVINPNITGVYQKIKNVTNYKNPSTSYKNFSREDGVIEYFYDKNKIYFNTNLSKDYIIEVDYKHFINTIRFKAVFLREDNSDKGLSPILNGYTLTFKPML